MPDPSRRCPGASVSAAKVAGDDRPGAEARVQRPRAGQASEERALNPRAGGRPAIWRRRSPWRRGSTGIRAATRASSVGIAGRARSPQAWPALPALTCRRRCSQRKGGTTGRRARRGRARDTGAARPGPRPWRPLSIPTMSDDREGDPAADLAASREALAIALEALRWYAELRDERGRR